MHVRVQTFASAVLVVLSIAAAACEDSRGVIRAGTAQPSPFQSRLISLEPAAIAPQFLRGTSCLTFPPFQTRFNLFLRTERDIFLQRFRFLFRDRSGRRVLPIAVPTSMPGSAGGRALPVTFPTSPAVPTPGVLPFHGTLVSPPFGTFGLLLNFDCGVPSTGTLSIDVETTDPDGVADVTTLSVPIG